MSRIAEETRISTRYLQALETGDTKVLPGSIFSRSFARQYARFVGLDESQIETELQEVFPPEDNVPAPEAREQRSPIQVAPLPDVVGATLSFRPQLYRSAIALLLVVAACSAVYMGWQRWTTERLEEADLSVPLSTAPASPAPPLTAASDSQPSEPGQASHAASIELAMPEEGDSGMSVRVVASEKTWLSITVNGHSVFKGFLEPNESRVLPGVERARMIIGNAGGVDVLTDGKSIGPIGPPGHVREVLLTPEGPQILRLSKEKKQKQDGAEGRS